MLAGWVIPLVGLLGLLPWVLITIRGLRRINRGHHAPEGARVVTFATLSVVAACLTLSALLYVDLIPTGLSRLLVSSARVALAAGGWTVLWMGRHTEDRP